MDGITRPTRPEMSLKEFLIWEQENVCEGVTLTP